jgi:photosynthetic reaction center H subunit
MIRYLEVELDGVFAGGPKRVLVPINMIDITKASWGRDASLTVDAITAAQFAGVPSTASPDRITLREEERIMGYYGAGYLYATPNRQEPLV